MQVGRAEYGEQRFEGGSCSPGPPEVLEEAVSV